MTALKATEELEALARSPVQVSAEEVHRLTLLATGDKKAAEEAHNAHRHAELRSGMDPA